MLDYDSKLFSKVIPSLLLQQRKCADVLQQAIHPPRLLEFMARLALFILLSIALTLSLQPAYAQPPGSGGPGSGGSGGGGLPGSGGSGSGGSPSWQMTTSSDGTVTSTTSTVTKTVAWNTLEESLLSHQTISFGQTVTITTAGTYHIVLKWLMPDGTTPPATPTPPQNVLVDATCAMTWDGPSDSTSGSGGSDLGPTVSSTGPYGVAAGEKYTVQTVQSSSPGKITYDIAVHATVTSSMVSGSNRVDVSRNLHATCTPIVLSLHGTTLDSGNLDNILIGQYCQASFVPQITPGQATPPVTFQNFQWTINDNTFKSYNVSDNQTGTNGLATVSYLTAADIASSSPSWSWITAGNGDVTVTADVYIMDASTGLPTTLVQASITDTHPVTVVSPVSSIKTVTGDAEVYATTASWLLGAVNPVGPIANTFGPGIKWTGQVNPPPLFSPNGQGSWRYVQIAAPQRSYSTSVGRFVSSLNGHKGLDGLYPYPAAPPLPPPYRPNAFNSTDGSGWQDDNLSYYSWDSPLMGLNNTIIVASVGDEFETYMMYKPSGGTWVPLRRVLWQWNATPAQPATGWAPATVGTVTVTGNTPWTTHPTWDELINGATATWIFK